MTAAEKKDVVNFAIPVSVDGQHYEGFTIRDGVVLELAPSACMPTAESLGLDPSACVPVRVMIKITNAKQAPQNVPYGGQFEVSKVANPKYFQVKPL